MPSHVMRALCLVVALTGLAGTARADLIIPPAQRYQPIASEIEKRGFACPTILQRSFPSPEQRQQLKERKRTGNVYHCSNGQSFLVVTHDRAIESVTPQQ